MYGVTRCIRSFKTYSTFNCHLSRDHALICKGNKIKKFQTIGMKTVCPLVACQNELSIDVVVQHLKWHIDEGCEVFCSRLRKDIF